jgi:hypothetical protein
MKSKQKNNAMVIYQAKSGAIELKADSTKETIWANQSQIASVFGVDVRTINEHIKNIYKTKELVEKPTIRKIRIVQTEGKREVEREINHYNLDVIIAVGYRVNSKYATQFRIWATQTLREFLTKGFVIDKKQIQKNYQEFFKAVESIQNLLPEHVTLDPKAIFDLVKEFSSTWVSLDAYDHDNLKSIGTTKKSIKLTGTELTEAITDFRNELLKKGEATEIFAQERNTGSITGIVGNVMQSFGGKDMYPSVEEKAAHLLYFMVKNHPYVDGNKRSGAFSFVWFLRKAKAKKFRNINPASLTALTLLIAESNPDKKDQMVALVTQMLK